MTSHDSNPYRLTRRRALAGAAWSAPVIVVASAVPAFAVSPGSSLDLRRGSSAVVVGQDPNDLQFYYDLQFTGLSVVVPGAGVTAGQLSLTVTFTPTNPGGPSNVFVVASPSGWSSSPAVGDAAPSVVFTYGSAAAGGSEVQVPNGIFAGSNEPTSVQTGTFVVTAAATGFTSDAESFATPPPGARPSGPVFMRPKV